MKINNLILIILGFLLSASSCRQEVSTLVFEDLGDKYNYTEGFTIDSKYYKNQKIKTIFVNEMKMGLNDPLEFYETGYYHIEITTSDSQKHIIRFVILDPERGEAEWGLKKFTPKEISIDQWDNSDIRIIAPKKVPENANVPVILIFGDETSRNIYNLEAELQSHTFNIKNGAGSINQLISSRENLKVSIASTEYPFTVDTFDTKAITIADSIKEDLTITANSFVHLEKDLYISKGVKLTIQSGAYFNINPGINIYNEGQLLLNGEISNPITLNCSEANDFWGGIISVGDNNSIKASYSIFCQSGFHDTGDFIYGHAHRQALFYMENGRLQLDQCFMIDHIGQILYPYKSVLEIKNSLIQRAKTGGQINYSEITIDNTVFTDFPNETSEYQDNDNDGLYIKASDATISNSVFMNAMDDGIDSGSDKGGTVHFYNCIFESIYHEGAALSSKAEVFKSHVFKNCIFKNCGQGIELGYSGINHHAEVDSCIFSENGIGIRWGDNYEQYEHDGTIHISNSYSINNLSHDIWNMNRETWEADTAKMSFSNVYVSNANSMYTDLKVYE